MKYDIYLNDLKEFLNRIKKSSNTKKADNLCLVLTDKFNSNELLVIKNSYSLKESKSLNLLILDFSLSGFDLNLKFDLSKNSDVNFDFCSILDSKSLFSKKFNISFLHKKEYSNSKLSFFGLNNLSSCSNNELYLIGEATILNKSIKSNTRIEGKVINLEQDSKSTVLPILNIEENDVNASHGAAVGCINNQVLYYLTSRGISVEQAKNLVTYGYIKHYINLLKESDSKLVESLLNDFI